MLPGILPLSVKRGAGMRRELTCETDETTPQPLDFTGYEFLLLAREKWDAPEAALELELGTGLELVGAPTAGVLAIVITAAQSLAIPKHGDYVYDCLAIPPTGEPFYLVEGPLTVKPSTAQ